MLFTFGKGLSVCFVGCNFFTFGHDLQHRQHILTGHAQTDPEFVLTYGMTSLNIWQSICAAGVSPEGLRVIHRV
jgi:hypothetical protein